MLNVRFVCWRVNVFFTMTWLQHKVLVPDKHRVYFPVLEEILNFLTLPFSIHLPRIISFRFLLFLKAVIVCSWNSSRKVLLVLRMFQFLRTAVVRFGKSWLYVNINGMRFESCCSQSFSCCRLSLKSLSTFSNLSSKSFHQLSWVMDKIFLGWEDSFYSKCLAIWDDVFLLILDVLSWC